MGFAIPSDTIKSSVQQILLNGRVTRPMLGISFAPEQAVETLGVKGDQEVISALIHHVLVKPHDLPI